MTKVALIYGVSGQDGSYLADLLIEKEYKVYGVIRMTTNNSHPNINHLIGHKNFFIRYGDVIDGHSISLLLSEINLDNPSMNILEVYNLAALSHVKVSFDLPEYCAQVTGLGPGRILEAIRLSGFSSKIRFYQASTSELFGKAVEVPQSENTPFYPRSPYGISKLYGFWITKNYRESYDLYACNGILFNHESPRRGADFVTRKITKGLSDIIHKRKSTLILGNLNAIRDWGHAKDYVYGMWLMLQQTIPDDYILCTSNCHTVKEFVELSFKLKGFDIKWQGSGLSEIGYDSITNQTLITVDPKFFRPAEVDILLGNCQKAHENLGWYPKISFNDLVKEMVESDCSI